MNRQPVIAGKRAGHSGVEQQVAELRGQIQDDLTALRGAWDRGRTWPHDLSRFPVAQTGQLLRIIPAWAAGILAGLLASLLMSRRGQPSTGESRLHNQQAVSRRQ